MTKVLVTYASSHGATAGIARTITNLLRDNGLVVLLKRMEDDPAVNEADAVVFGSAVYIGDWLPKAVEFVKRHEVELCQRPCWVFSSGPTGGGNPVELLNGSLLPESVQEIIERVDPREVVVFHGKIDLRRLTKNERTIVKAAKIPKGDYRNWHAIKFWAQHIADTLKAELGTADENTPEDVPEAETPQPQTER